MTDDAIFSLPNYLLIVVIITTLLFTILSQGVMVFKEQAQIQEMKISIENIITSADYLMNHGKQGSRISKTMIVPSCIDFVSFGPPPYYVIEKLGFQNKSLFPDNLYVICYKDGRIEQYYTDILFFPDSSLETYLFLEGHHEVVIDIVERKGNSYVCFSSS